MVPLTRAYVPEVIITMCIYGCVRARDVFIHSVRARGKFIELLVRLTSTPKLHLERKEFTGTLESSRLEMRLLSRGEQGGHW